MMTAPALDPFGPVAEGYATYRPRYPRAVFHYLAAVAPATRLAIDVAAGSGQATLGLAAHFRRVLALDVSARQLAAMPDTDGHVHRAVARAELLPCTPHGADLVLAAQAFHWFEPDAFFTEASRALRPQGILALLSYDLSVIAPEIDRAIRRFHDVAVGEDWPIDRASVLGGYAAARLPGRALAQAQFVIEATLGVEAYLGYLATWSAVTRQRARTGVDPLDAFGAELRAAWGDAPRRVRWPLRLRASRV
ncbi:MAG: class I SAM-dependent methyltransferase [Gemmatimonadaceae bacterium]|nr:class I SAM-dependent methyltransferase [Gemmatimonadaceae bacterium]